MNAEQVVEKILSQARDEAAGILTEAKDKAAGQKAALESELAEFNKKTEEMAADAAADKLQRMLASARMANAKQMLSSKVAIIDDVFEQAKAAVNQLPDKDYLELMTALMKKSVETGDEEVIVGKSETRIDDSFIKDVNRQLGTGFKGNLRMSSQKGDFAGGFILARGKVQINACTDVLIERLRETLDMELSAELFAD
ncbi:MAG: V-type ATP synthase subunit E [Planctomycetota bacterium]|jgi:V/A-type H+-transporting ATPase subunit E